MLRRLLDRFKPAAAVNPIRTVDPAEIRAWWDAGQVVLVDVREPDEYAAEAIPGAVNLPLSAFDPARVPRPAGGQHLVMHCQRGVRCAPAAAQMVAAGWTGEVVRMKGGLVAWKEAGGPTVTPG